jgi:anti-sigma-K factor RskA
MNYSTESLRNALAAEYVLGTLRGSARKRFQQLIMQYSAIRETTWIWEQHLNVMGGRVAPIAVDDKVWRGITQRLGFVSEEQGSTAEIIHMPSSARSRWMGISSLATAAAIVMAVLLWRQQAPPTMPIPAAQQVAVMQSKDAQPLWLIEVKANTLEIQATSNITKRNNNDYELWMVAKDGRPPVSLGLLPQSGRVSLAKHPLFDQLDIAVLAVSLEPLNGSPTGAPTEVLFTTPLVLT